MKCRKLNLFPCVGYSLRKFNSRAVPFSPCSGPRVPSGSASFCQRMGYPGFAGTRDVPAFPPRLNPPFPRILEMIEFPALLTAVFSKSECRLDTRLNARFLGRQYSSSFHEKIPFPGARAMLSRCVGAGLCCLFCVWGDFFVCFGNKN